MNGTDHRLIKSTHLSVTPDGEVNLTEKVKLEKEDLSNFYVTFDRTFVKCKKILDQENPVKDFTFRLLPGYVETRLDVTENGALVFVSKGFLPVIPLFTKFCKVYHGDIRTFPHIRVSKYRGPEDKADDILYEKPKKKTGWMLLERNKNFQKQSVNGVPCPNENVKLINKSSIPLNWHNESKYFKDDLFIEIAMNYAYKNDEILFTVLGWDIRIEAEHVFGDEREGCMRMLKYVKLPECVDTDIIKAAISETYILVYTRPPCT